MAHQEAFRERCIKVVSELQEISIGWDASPDEEHDSDDDEGVQSFEHETRHERQQYEDLFTSEAPHAPPAFWSAVHHALFSMYEEGRVDGALNHGDENKAGRASRQQSLKVEVPALLFRVAKAAGSSELVLFGHGMWIRQLFKANHGRVYDKCKLDNMGLVEFVLSRSMNGTQFRIAEPCPRPGMISYTAWGKSSMQVKLAATEGMAEFQEFVAAMKARHRAETHRADGRMRQKRMWERLASIVGTLDWRRKNESRLVTMTVAAGIHKQFLADSAKITTSTDQEPSVVAERVPMI